MIEQSQFLGREQSPRQSLMRDPCCLMVCTKKKPAWMNHAGFNHLEALGRLFSVFGFFQSGAENIAQ
jgi:hypothetical protein